MKQYHVRIVVVSTHSYSRDYGRGDGNAIGYGERHRTILGYAQGSGDGRGNGYADGTGITGGGGRGNGSNNDPFAGPYGRLVVQKRESVC